MSATQSYKTITLRTYFKALIALNVRRAELDRWIADTAGRSDDRVWSDLEYWQKELAEIEAAIAELEAA